MAIPGVSRLLTEPKKRRLSTVAKPLSAALLYRPAEILELTPFVNSLSSLSGMLAPRFFLASLVSEPYRPCVVAVSRGQRIVGVLYGKERRVAGIPTGIVLADDTLGTMIAAHPGEAEAVIRCAVSALLKRKTALRWRVSADRLPLLESVSAGVGADIHTIPGEHHAHLPLPGTYNDFLARVGRYTRHNLNRYRRRSEQSGNQFCSALDFAEFCAASRHLHPNSAYALTRAGLDRALAMIREMPSRLLVGIRNNGGEWISLAGLWLTGGKALMALQLNNRSCVRESVSLVLRASLIDYLIQRGINELIFLDGVSAPLSDYTQPQKELIAYIDSRSLPWLAVRHACVTLARLAPSTFGNWQAWHASRRHSLTEN